MQSPDNDSVSAEPALLLGRLLQQPGEFDSLLQRVRRIEALDHALRLWLGDPTPGAIRVANLRGETLIVFADSAASLTKLRYQQESLLAYLRERHGIPVNRLDAKVRPGLARRRV